MTTIKAANAPCSWGTLEFEGMQGERIGYQQMLDELVATGYTATELGDWGFMPTDPDQLHWELAQRELMMLGAFTGVAFRNAAVHAEGQSRVLQTARLLAGVADKLNQPQKPFVVLADDNGVDPIRTRNAGRVTPEMGLSQTEWQTFARGVEQVAQAVRDETGLPSVFHHHCAGFVETADEIARLLELTNPELVGLVFDTGHYAFGAGGEQGCETVMAALHRFADRIWYIHFKDCQPEVARQARNKNWAYFEALRHGVFCELGQGCVDFPGVMAWLRQRNYQGWITVEQDVLPGMGSPKESAQRNRDYLRGIGL